MHIIFTFLHAYSYLTSMPIISYDKCIQKCKTKLTTQADYSELPVLYCASRIITLSGVASSKALVGHTISEVMRF